MYMYIYMCPEIKVSCSDLVSCLASDLVSYLVSDLVSNLVSVVSAAAAHLASVAGAVAAPWQETLRPGSGWASIPHSCVFGEETCMWSAQRAGEDALIDGIS